MMNSGENKSTTSALAFIDTFAPVGPTMWPATWFKKPSFGWSKSVAMETTALNEAP